MTHHSGEEDGKNEDIRLKSPERIETSRLIFQRPKSCDANDIFRRYATDTRVTRYLSWPTHETLDDTQFFIQLSNDEWERWPAGPYLIFLKQDNSNVDDDDDDKDDETPPPLLIGSTGLSFNTDKTAEVGYVLAHDSWGKGYATESLKAMVQVASSTGVEELLAWVHPENTASMHVLTKCDFELQETLVDGELPNIPGGEKVAQVCRYILNLSSSSAAYK